MAKHFVIDKITECIEEVATGEIVETDVLTVAKNDLELVLKKNGWHFPWRSYLKMTDRLLYKLVIRDDTQQNIQGLLSIEIMDNFIEMHHIETAPHNFGPGKQYAGVCGSLVAFACKISYDLKFEGFVAFTAKTKLVPHYETTLGAQIIMGAQRMAIYPNSAKKLVDSYYKNHWNANKKNI